MITLKDTTKAPAEIARLTKMNEEAAERIKNYMAESANFRQVRNARVGVIMREERIAELQTLV